jgi:hypothetical protein
MRAASWLREGRRPVEEVLSAFGISSRSGLGCGAADEFAFMARSIVMAAAHKGQPLRCEPHRVAYSYLTRVGTGTFLCNLHYQYKSDKLFSSTALYHVDDYTLSC